MSSPLDGLSGLEVMIPPIVGVTVDQPSRYPAARAAVCRKAAPFAVGKELSGRPGRVVLVIGIFAGCAATVCSGAATVPQLHGRGAERSFIDDYPGRPALGGARGSAHGGGTAGTLRRPRPAVPEHVTTGSPAMMRLRAAGAGAGHHRRRACPCRTSWSRPAPRSTPWPMTTASRSSASRAARRSRPRATLTSPPSTSTAAPTARSASSRRFRPGWTVQRPSIREELIFPTGVTKEQSQQESAVAMTTSQENAVASALKELDIPFGQKLQVGGPLRTARRRRASSQAGDVFASINGKPITSLRVVQEELAAGNGKPATVVVDRGRAARHGDHHPHRERRRPVHPGRAAAVPLHVPVRREDFPRQGGRPERRHDVCPGHHRHRDARGPDRRQAHRRDRHHHARRRGGTHRRHRGRRCTAHGRTAPRCSWPRRPTAPKLLGHIPDGLQVVKVENLAEARRRRRTGRDQAATHRVFRPAPATRLSAGTKLHCHSWQ